MKKSQLVAENLKLSKALLQQILDDPSILEEISEGANVIVLPLDNVELFKANLEQLILLKERGVKNLLVAVLEGIRAVEPRLVVKV